MVELLTTTSKMPGRSWSLPARKTCPTGSRLACDKNSVCGHCYAQKGRYTFANVKAAQERRWAISKTDDFVPLMVDALGKELKAGRVWFRWHDSGDSYSYEYMKKILDVCRRTPGMVHRIPTREVPMVRRAVKEGLVPENLVIQISGNYLDTVPTNIPEGCQASVVFSKEPPAGAFVCPATMGAKKCGDCRACWSKEIGLIAYKKH